MVENKSMTEFYRGSPEKSSALQSFALIAADPELRAKMEEKLAATAKK